MKTPEQIKAWLEAQPWYDQFKANTLNSKHSEYRKHLTLNGKSGLDTITGAFSWIRSHEGPFFWIEVGNQFLKWYHDDEENPD